MFHFQKILENRYEHYKIRQLLRLPQKANAKTPETSAAYYSKKNTSHWRGRLGEFKKKIAEKKVIELINYLTGLPRWKIVTGNILTEVSK